MLTCGFASNERVKVNMPEHLLLSLFSVSLVYIKLLMFTERIELVTIYWVKTACLRSILVTYGVLERKYEFVECLTP